MNSESVGDMRDGALQLHGVVGALWRQKWWVAMAAAVGSMAFAFFAYTATPIYRASTVLIPAASEDAPLGSGLGALVGVASMAGLAPGLAASNEDEAIAVLKSREFLGAYIVEMGLLPALFPSRWDASSKKWREPQSEPSLALAHKEFSGSVLSVAKDRTNGLVTVSIEWRDRDRAAQWANDLVDRLNLEMKSRALAQAEASLGYLKSELNGTIQVGVQEAINRLIEAQIRKRMVANVTQQYVFRVVDRASPPDESDTVRPRRMLLVLCGLILGFAFGVMGVLLATVLPRRI